jgi:hypothetical protein
MTPFSDSVGGLMMNDRRARMVAGGDERMVGREIPRATSGA